MSGYTDIALTPQALHEFYTGYFAYYRSLDEQWKKKFVSRCQLFISTKQITGAAGFKPDNKVKSIIAASAVQLTLGLQEWFLGYFDSIIVHPDDFENKALGFRFKGETNLAGYIHLSWKSFINGYLIDNDNINLGLHEFTHALRFNSFRGADQDYFIEHFFSRWLATANEAFEDIRSGRPSIFRKYGGANINEFMSVCFEHFFESPEEIKKHYQFLYYSTAILLNQICVDGKTYLNVREVLFNDLFALHCPVTSKELKTQFFRTNSFPIIGVTLLPLIITVIKTGFFSAASSILFLIMALVYLHYDFNFLNLHLETGQMTLRKGFLVFRNRKKVIIPLSQLISLRTYEAYKGTDYEFIYFNFKDNSFYSELVEAGGPADTALLSDLWRNRIAIFRSRS